MVVDLLAYRGFLEVTNPRFSPTSPRYSPTSTAMQSSNQGGWGGNGGMAFGWLSALLIPSCGVFVGSCWFFMGTWEVSHLHMRFTYF
jgi:hypothetical protein